MYEERKSLDFLSFLFTLCHKLSKTWGYFNTHLSSYPDNQFEHLKRRSEQHRQLCSALHAYKFAVATSELQRTQSRHYTLYGRIKVYEVTFKVQVADNLLARE